MVETRARAPHIPVPAGRIAGRDARSSRRSSQRWDALTAHRRVVALAGTDAHARLDLSGDDSGGGLDVEYSGLRADVPALSRSPRPGSRSHTMRMRIARRCSRPSGADTSIRPSTPSRHRVPQHSRPAAAVQRGWLGTSSPQMVATSSCRSSTTVRQAAGLCCIKDGRDCHDDRPIAGLRQVVPATRAVYRVEIQLPRAPGNPPVPWVVTNPIYVRSGDDEPEKRGDATSSAAQYENGEARGWRIETSPRSKAALDVARTISGTELLLRWAIGGTKAESPYAAFAMPAGDALPAYDRLLFTARADRSMRLSVQFRLQNGSRWRRSVHLDGTPRPIVVFFDDVRPIDPTSERRLPLGQVRDVLFVVDTVNAAPGSAGQFRIDDVKYGR